MPKKTGTATEFVLQTLIEYSDNEMQISDLFDHCQGRFTKENLSNSLSRLLAVGKVVRNLDGRSAYWAIASK